MKVKFLDVVHVTNTLYKEGDIGEFSELTANELVEKGLAELAEDSDGTEKTDVPKQSSRQSSKTNAPASAAK